MKFIIKNNRATHKIIDKILLTQKIAIKNKK